MIGGAIAYVRKGTDPGETLNRAIVAHKDTRHDV